jgi:hypothetical protein
LGRRASSSASVGVAAIWQWSGSPRNLNRAGFAGGGLV